jgi:pimeloyl-ACP methyl ester carboxylesterase
VLRAYGGGSVFGEPYGEGVPRVVWLHGWARSGRDFAESARELARSGIASVALDLPGFGASPPPVAAGGARLYAELIRPALAELADEPLLLVGHSFGGTVAVAVAAAHPELVRGLVLTGAPLIRQVGGVRPPWRYRAVRWLAAKHLVGEARLEAMRQRYGSTDYRRAAGVLRDVLVASVHESYEAELARIDVPVSMLWGALDADVPEAVARSAASLLPGPHVSHVLARVGHLVPTEAPSVLASTVREALV